MNGYNVFYKHCILGCQVKILIEEFTAYRITNHLGQTFYFLFIDWRENRNFYLVVYSLDRSRPVAEIHNIVSNMKLTSLHWKYKPMKQDGRNKERRKYLKRYYLQLKY